MTCSRIARISRRIAAEIAEVLEEGASGGLVRARHQRLAREVLTGDMHHRLTVFVRVRPAVDGSCATRGAFLGLAAVHD